MVRCASPPPNLATLHVGTPQFWAAVCFEMACIAMRPALLVVLAVLGPRASAQLVNEQGSGALPGVPTPMPMPWQSEEGSGAVSGSGALSGGPTPMPMPWQSEEGSGAVSGNISGNGSVNGSSICSLCQGAINENDDVPDLQPLGGLVDLVDAVWLSQESHVNPDVMTACAVAIIRACYLDGMNMPSSLCEDDAYPIADALGGGGSPELNDPNFDFNSLTGCVARSAPPCSLALPLPPTRRSPNGW